MNLLRFSSELFPLSNIIVIPSLAGFLFLKALKNFSMTTPNSFESCLLPSYIVSERKLENFSKKLTWSRPKKRNRRKISPQKAFLIARAVFSIH